MALPGFERTAWRAKPLRQAAADISHVAEKEKPRWEPASAPSDGFYLSSFSFPVLLIVTSSLLIGIIGEFEALLGRLHFDVIGRSQGRFPFCWTGLGATADRE
jgi:hypothetical protein